VRRWGTAAVGIMLAVLAMGAADTVVSADDDPTGHWTFVWEPPAAGRGRGAGGQAVVARTADLWLRPGPGNSLTGTLGIDAGRSGGAPGTNPLRPVELSDGRIDGNQLSFSVWQFDRHTNRVRYEGTLHGDVLDLTLSRDTPDGVETRDVRATRAAE